MFDHELPKVKLWYSSTTGNVGRFLHLRSAHCRLLHFNAPIKNWNHSRQDLLGAENLSSRIKRKACFPQISTLVLFSHQIFSFCFSLVWQSNLVTISWATLHEKSLSPTPQHILCKNTYFWNGIHAYSSMVRWQYARPYSWLIHVKVDFVWGL